MSTASACATAAKRIDVRIAVPVGTKCGSSPSSSHRVKSTFVAAAPITPQERRVGRCPLKTSGDGNHVQPDIPTRAATAAFPSSGPSTNPAPRGQQLRRDARPLVTIAVAGQVGATPTCRSSALGSAAWRCGWRRRNPGLRKCVLGARARNSDRRWHRGRRRPTIRAPNGPLAGTDDRRSRCQ
jgi:hypothetical protein